MHRLRNSKGRFIKIERRGVPTTPIIPTLGAVRTTPSNNIVSKRTIKHLKVSYENYEFELQ